MDYFPPEVDPRQTEGSGLLSKMRLWTRGESPRMGPEGDERRDGYSRGDGYRGKPTSVSLSVRFVSEGVVYVKIWYETQGPEGLKIRVYRGSGVLLKKGDVPVLGRTTTPTLRPHLCLPLTGARP